MTTEKNKLPISRAQIEHLIKQYSKEHHIHADEMYSIMSELVTGFEFLRQFKKAVSIYGSARMGFDSDIYNQAYTLAGSLAKDGFAIITGAGPGIMEAANRGAMEAGGQSIGLNITLKHKQPINKYVTDSRQFNHFYIRKTMLSFASKIYIFFPGGFGTVDELFEMLMLVQTEKIPRIPIILVNKEFWTPLIQWIASSMFEENKAINEDDMRIYYLVDNAKEAHELINKLMKEKKVPF